MSSFLRSNKLITSFLISVGILIIGFFINHNKAAFIALAIFLFSIDINNHILKLKISKTDNLIKTGILFFIICELAYTFFLQYHAPIDGDFAITVLPEEEYKNVFADPFGFNVLFHHVRYTATNRFFIHFFLYEYFNTIPFLFQHFASPIDSIYLSCALSKMLIKVMLIYIFSVYVCGQYRIFNKQFLIAAILITPMIQTCGFIWATGIIDPAVTASFGYAFCVGLLFVFLMPFFLAFHHEKTLNINYIRIVLLILLLMVIAFSCPLNAPVIIIICPPFLLYQWWRGIKYNNDVPFSQRALLSVKQIPKPVLITFIFAILISLYSFYIGTYNDENPLSPIPLWQRYLRIPAGLQYVFCNKGMLLQLLLILVNIAILFSKKANPQAQRILRLLFWIILFSTVYTLLLPLGGYRPYRATILRRDTMLPVLIAIIIFYGVSTFYILKHISTPVYKKIYAGGVAILLLLFVVTDNNNKFDNSCEKNALQQIADSKDKIVPLSNDCEVLYWGKVIDYKDSKTVTSLLLKYKIINEEKYFYQK